MFVSAFPRQGALTLRLNTRCSFSTLAVKQERHCHFVKSTLRHVQVELRLSFRCRARSWAFRHFAEADEVRVVEVVGIGTHVEESFAVFDVLLADVGSGGSVWELDLLPKFIAEPGPVLFLASFIEV